MSVNLRDAKNRRITLRALGFDRGYLPDVVHRSLYVIRKTGVRLGDGSRVPVPFQMVAVRGFPWNKFGTRSKDMLRRSDHVFATRSQYGEYLAEMAPYWREIMQSGFLETPLMPGSLSLYGTNPVEHFELANEICAEKLVRKYTVETGRGRSETAWDWSCVGENHYCDVLTGCFAVASWFHCYDALSSVIDSAAYGSVSVDGRRVNKVVPVAHQDDLFDPRLNRTVVESAGYDRGCEKELQEYLAAHPERYDGMTDETEGTGDAGVAPYHGDVESTRDPLVDADPRPRARPSTGYKKRVHKFRRGRYKK